MDQQPIPPAPGSPEAIRLGCQCPVLDNQEREGSGTYVISSRCSMHWRKGAPSKA